MSSHLKFDLHLEVLCAEDLLGANLINLLGLTVHEQWQGLGAIRVGMNETLTGMGSSSIESGTEPVATRTHPQLGRCSDEDNEHWSVAAQQKTRTLHRHRRARS